MVSKVRHKRSTTPGAAPAAGDIQEGELWLNLADKKAFFKDSGGTVIHVDLNTTASNILSKLLTVDGAGSGLDADLLDGSHASAFATTGHTHSEYVAKAGGTLTGPLNINANSNDPALKLKQIGAGDVLRVEDEEGDTSPFRIGPDGTMYCGAISPYNATATRTGLVAAPAAAKYIIQQTNSELTNAQVLGSLATGILKNTTSTGVLSIATPGTDYYAPGSTDVSVADGGTGASDAPTARTNLGLGSIATQNSNSVTITGGSISGITDLSIADGGTGASTALDAFNALKQAATETYTGVVELATTTEASAGTDTTRAVTAAGILKYREDRLTEVIKTGPVASTSTFTINNLAVYDHFVIYWDATSMTVIDAAERVSLSDNNGSSWAALNIGVAGWLGDVAQYEEAMTWIYGVGKTGPKTFYSMRSVGGFTDNYGWTTPSFGVVNAIRVNCQSGQWDAGEVQIFGIGKK